MRNKQRKTVTPLMVLTSLMLLVGLLFALGISNSPAMILVPIIAAAFLIFAGKRLARLGMAGMAGQKSFSLEQWNPRVQNYQTSNYTATLTDEAITMNGSNLVLTLPLIGSLQGTVLPNKAYQITNLATTPLSVIPSVTVDPVLNTLNTINAPAPLPPSFLGTPSPVAFTVLPNQTIVIAANQGDNNWQVVSPYPVPALKQVPFSVAVLTNGTTPVNVFDAGGAPVNMTITGLLIIPLATAANTVTLAAGANTIATAVAATAGVPIGETAAPVAAYQNVLAGTALTLTGSSANNAIAIVFGYIQQYA